MAVQLTNNEEFPPPMALKIRRPCSNCDHGVDGIQIVLQIVELAAYCCDDFAVE